MSDYSKQVAKFKAITGESNAVLANQIQQARATMVHSAVGDSGLTYDGDVIDAHIGNTVVKPYVPEWLYRPLYGRPRNINIPQIRRMARSPTAAACIKTIVDQVSSVDWVIRMRDPEQSSNDAAIEEVTERLMNPNRNKENFKIVIKKLTKDLLEVDSAVIAKIYDRVSYEGGDINGKLLPLGRRSIKEFYVYDGSSFTINPNEHGVLPDQRAYWQYTNVYQNAPIPFARDEIIYMMNNPRTDTIYGLSPTEMCFDIIRYILFANTSGIDYFTRNGIPRGILSIIDAETEHINEFRARLGDKVNIQDPLTDEVRYVSNTVPVTNQDTKFTSLEMTPDVLRLLETQQWYNKVVFSCYGVTGTEMGFVEDVNKATAGEESDVFKRKTILPLLDTLEYFINRELVPEFGFEELVFEFVRSDEGKERRDQLLWNDWLKNGQCTVNEWRSGREDLEPVEWGDEPMSGGGFGSMFDTSVDNNLVVAEEGE